MGAWGIHRHVATSSWYSDKPSYHGRIGVGTDTIVTHNDQSCNQDDSAAAATPLSSARCRYRKGLSLPAFIRRANPAWWPTDLVESDCSSGERGARSLGVIDTLSAGYAAVNRRLWLLSIPSRWT